MSYLPDRTIRGCNLPSAGTWWAMVAARTSSTRRTIRSTISFASARRARREGTSRPPAFRRPAISGHPLAVPGARPRHLHRLERSAPRRLFLGLRRGRARLYCMAGATRTPALHADIFSLYARPDYGAGRRLPMVRRQRVRRTYADGMLRHAWHLGRHADCARASSAGPSATDSIRLGVRRRTGGGRPAGAYASVPGMVACGHVRPARGRADGAGCGKRAYLPAYRATALVAARRIHRHGRAVG